MLSLSKHGGRLFSNLLELRPIGVPMVAAGFQARGSDSSILPGASLANSCAERY